MRKTQALVLAGALAITLSACGGGADDDARAAEAISQSMQDASDEDFTVDETQGDCVGEGLVDRIGVDKLTDYGLLSDDLTVDEDVTDVTMEQADADSAADVFVSCLDAEKMMSEELAAGEDLTEEQQACIAEVLDEDALQGMFSLIFQGKEDEATGELMGPLMSCIIG